MAESTYAMRLELAERRRMLMKALARRPAGKESRLFQTLSSSSMAPEPVSEGKTLFDIHREKQCIDVKGRDDETVAGDGSFKRQRNAGGVAWSNDAPRTTTTDKATSESEEINGARKSDGKFSSLDLIVKREPSMPPLLARLSDSSDDSASLPPLKRKVRVTVTSPLGMQRRWGGSFDSTQKDKQVGDPSCSASFSAPPRPQRGSLQTNYKATITKDRTQSPNNRRKPLFTPSLSDIVRRDPPVTMDESVATASTTDRRMADLRKARLKRLPNRPPLQHHQRLFLETRIQSKQRTTLIVGSPRRQLPARTTRLHYDTDDERDNVPTNTIVRPRTAVSIDSPTTLVNYRSSPSNIGDDNNLGTVKEFFQNLLAASDDFMPSDEDHKSFDSDDDSESHPSLEESQSFLDRSMEDCNNMSIVDESRIGGEDRKPPLGKKEPLKDVIDLDLVTVGSSKSNGDVVEVTSSTVFDTLPTATKDTKVFRFYEPEESSSLQLLLGSFMDQDGGCSVKSLDRQNSKLPSSSEDIQEKYPLSYFHPPEVKENLQTIVQGKPAWTSITEDHDATKLASYPIAPRLSVLKALSLSSNGTSSRQGLVDSDELIRTLSSGSDSIAASFEALIADLQGLVSDSTKIPHSVQNPEGETLAEALVSALKSRNVPPGMFCSGDSKPSDGDSTEVSTGNPCSSTDNDVLPRTKSRGREIETTLSMERSSAFTSATGEMLLDPMRVTSTSESESKEIPSLNQSCFDSTHGLTNDGLDERPEQKPNQTHTKLLTGHGVGAKIEGAQESGTPLVSNARRFSFCKKNETSQESSVLKGSSAKSFDCDTDDVEHLEHTLTQIKAVLQKTEQMKRTIKVAVEDVRSPPTKVISFTPKSQRGAIEVEFFPHHVDKILSTTNESLDRLSLSDRLSTFNESNLTVTSSLTENTADDDYEGDSGDDDDSSSTSSSSSSGDDVSSSSDEEIASTVPSEILTKNTILQSCSTDPQSLLHNVESNNENESSCLFEKEKGSDSKERQAIVVPGHERSRDSSSCQRALTEITTAVLCRCTGPIHSPLANESFDVTGREVVVVGRKSRISQLV
ncbi:hypothetical protein IV203_003245 [Nitzschia inconspicua]|uniref:Uncharacterized protein n=1 Tax=Nitzschia inconspicua TaxID=303405 RepID=A0A9K3PNF3_9STRA|nr:hypothetical protein IV203_003245 [Nitzschia inconspicua]